MIPFVSSVFCRNIGSHLRSTASFYLSSSRISSKIRLKIEFSTKALRYVHISAYNNCKSEMKKSPNQEQPKENKSIKVSKVTTKSKGNIVVKTETDDNKNVTKVTIEKPKEAAKSSPQAVAPPGTSGNTLFCYWLKKFYKATILLLFDISAKKRLLIDFSASYTERNFITPMRAMTEYLLKQSDLESLPKVFRRSPYESEPPITVYYRKDVEAKANEVRMK